MVLIAILLGTLTAGIGSVWVAALLSFGLLARYTQHMLSLAAGALLATAFMHLMPEAFESQAGAHDLFITLLVGLVFFSCWTRPSCGTTAMNITMNLRIIRTVIRKTIRTPIPTRTAIPTAIPTRITAMPTAQARSLRVPGRYSLVTACTALATAC